MNISLGFVEYKKGRGLLVESKRELISDLFLWTYFRVERRSVYIEITLVTLHINAFVEYVIQFKGWNGGKRDRQVVCPAGVTYGTQLET